MFFTLQNPSIYNMIHFPFNVDTWTVMWIHGQMFFI